jgi:hypothetical protein
MATYYWVGGSGTWDTSSTTNWSATSGGSGGAGVPTTADDVIFDVNSGPGGFPASTVTVSGFVDCKSFSTTNAAPVVFTGGALQVSGSFQLLSDPGGFGFNIDLRLVPATASGLFFNSIATIAFLQIFDTLGLPTTITLNSNITSPLVRVQVGLVPSGTYSINCERFELIDSTSAKVLGSASHPLAINVTPAVATSSQAAYLDNWSRANDSIVNTTLTLTPNSNKNYIRSNTLNTNTAKQIDFNVTDGITGIDVTGPLFQNITITNAQLNIVSITDLFGVFTILGNSIVTSDSTFTSSYINIAKRAGSSNVSRALTVPGTSQWIKIGLRNTVAEGTDTISISGNFGTLSNEIPDFYTGAAAVGAGTVFASNILLSTGTSLSNTVFNPSIFFTISSGASVTGAYTVNANSTFLNPNGVLVPNLNISANGSASSLQSNLLVTNLSITRALGAGEGGLLVRNGSSITVNGTFTLTGASASEIVDLKAYDLFGNTPLPWSIIKSSGTVDATFARIAYSNASGGAKFQAFTGNGCIDGGNNTGWIFSQSLGNFFVLL